MSNSKKLITNSFLYVVLGFLPLATNFFLAPVYSRYISPEEYGIIALSFIFQGFLSLFITFGLEAGFSRIYFDYYKKEQLVETLMSTTLLAILAGSILFWILLYFFGEMIFAKLLQNNQFTYEKYGSLVFFITLSTALHSVFLSYYRNKEEVFNYSLVALSFFFTSVAGILIGVVYLKAEALGNIAGRAFGATSVIILLMLIYFFRSGLKFKYKYLKKSLIYSLPLVPYLFLLMVYNNIDKIMIEQYFELDVLGLYNFAFQLASVISVFIYAVFNAVSPHIFKLLTDGGGENINEIKKIHISFHLLVIGIISLGCALIIPILELLISEKYQAIQNYISILILVYIFQIYYVIYTIPLFFHNKTKILPWISLIVLIIGVISNLVFIPVFGIYGVCLALFFTKSSQFFVAYFFVRYYGYNKIGYLSLKKNHIVSGLIVFIFGIVFGINYKYHIVADYLINILPLLIFTLSVLLFFRKEILHFRYLIKKPLYE